MPRPSHRWLTIAHRSVWVQMGSPAAVTLEAAAEALSNGDRAEALRQLDRAWRIAPEHRGAVGPVYAAQLLADNNPAAAAAALRTSLKLDPRVDTAALLQRALQSLGRPAEPNPDLDIDGRAWEYNGLIEGWVRNGADPDTPLRVRIEDGAGHSVQLKCSPHESGNSRQGFQLKLKGSRLEGSGLRVFVLLADGTAMPLPDTPLLLPAAVRVLPPRSTAPVTKLAPPAKRAVDVVIPVYRNYDDTVACVESVLSSKRPAGDIVVIDDCSPEPRISAWLKGAAARKRITLLRNKDNLGFSAAVNRGIALHPERDVVVLNSDTLVFGDWLKRLKAAAHSAPKIGSVTPLTNDGSIASFPRYTASELSAAQAADLDRLAARVNRGVRGELPVGVGFCQYFTRECLNAAGELDAAVFGAGYGEEVDLCMRAAEKGFRHLLAADVFVLHKGGNSFGKRRAALMDRNQRLVNLRYPQFQSLVDEHNKRNPSKEARRNLAEAVLVRAAGKNRTLLVTLPWTGGVERFVDERAAAIENAGGSTLKLRADAALKSAVLTGRDAGVDLQFDLTKELPRLMSLLRKLKFSGVELHHFLGLPPKLVEAVFALNSPVDAYIHDYVWICPQITLVDKSGSYCGEPELKACERCIRQKKPNLPEKIGVKELRQRSARWLAKARKIITPSADVSRRLAKHFPGLQTEIRPWQKDVAVRPRFVPPAARVRVALLGAIGQHKGYDVLIACARDAQKRDLPLEFSVVGYSQDDAALRESGRVFLTGAYQESELSALLRRENPHVIFLPSVTPETWSFTLTTALGTGLPIVAFDLGAIAERMHRMQRGLLLPPSTPPRELNDHLLRTALNPAR